jgi:pSer/pThr/pTyr-binding forkhead associated (FHA) protein
VGTTGATLGRTSENGIHIPDTKLSRQHARIEQREGAFVLTDLGSTNGTFLNYRRLEAPASLRTGDVIGVGESRLVVEVE